ncbi:MAG TPA: isochorismate synthase [Polyangiaceae bacterium]|nr:isochorismate synthase [Polyangiaceae bacterium]
MTEMTRPAPVPTPGTDPPRSGGSWGLAVNASDARDPWERLEMAAGHRDWFAWHDGRRGLSYVAWGAVARFSPRGPDRFAQVRDWIAPLVDRLPAEAPGLMGALPLAVGGFSFTPRCAEPGPLWGRWPDGAFIVPETIVARHPTGTSVTATLRPPRGWRVPSATDPQPNRAGPRLTTVESREHYEQLVTATVRRIDAGGLEKAVIARPATILASDRRRFDPIAVLRALRDGHPRAVCFAMARGGEVFLGASPETLVAMHGGLLATQAVAGTTKADEDEGGARLRRSAKDEHEHVLVVQSIERALGPLCDDLTVGPRRLARAGDVHHIVTGIDATPRTGTTVLDAVAALHPTAALCGTPRHEAAAWIAEREGFDRGWYGAPIGWLGPDGDGVFAVAIRSALLSDHVATAFVGAGIVHGSSPAAEWEETEAKLGPVRRALDAGLAVDRTPGTHAEPTAVSMQGGPP